MWAWSLLSLTINSSRRYTGSKPWNLRVLFHVRKEILQMWVKNQLRILRCGDDCELFRYALNAITASFLRGRWRFNTEEWGKVITEAGYSVAGFDDAGRGYSQGKQLQSRKGKESNCSPGASREGWFPQYLDLNSKTN